LAPNDCLRTANFSSILASQFKKYAKPLIASYFAGIAKVSPYATPPPKGDYLDGIGYDLKVAALC
jgi:hypothetical protein